MLGDLKSRLSKKKKKENYEIKNKKKSVYNY